VTAVAFLVVLALLLALLGRCATPRPSRTALRDLRAADLAGLVAGGVHVLLTLPPRVPR
jgi:hypothetical protein